MAETVEVPGAPAVSREPRRARRIPPNLFSVAFGLAGLAGTWRAASPLIGTPKAVPDGIDVVSAVTWLLIAFGYFRQGWSQIIEDLRDSVLAPFVSLFPITGMLLSVALATHAFDAGRIGVGVFLGATVAFGGWITGQWIVEPLDRSALHPGYFLPTVAGGLVGSAAASAVHMHALAVAAFGIGTICWFLLGAIIVNRLFFDAQLPPPLLPTLAIELAPPVVAGVAYFALDGLVASPVAVGLGGYAVLMAVVQLRLVTVYRQLSFSAGFWAFTFSYAAAATDGMEWIATQRPTGATTWAVLDLAVISTFVAAIAVRSLVGLRRGTFLPPAIPR